MKMLEQHWQAMLQPHLRDFIAYYDTSYTQRFDSNSKMDLDTNKFNRWHCLLNAKYMSKNVG